MSNRSNDMSEKLVQYLDAELSADDKMTIEQQIASDKNLQEELEQLKLAREAVRSYGLQQEVAAVHHDMMREMTNPVRQIPASRRIIRYSMSIAAGLLIIFMSITAYNYFSVSPAKLFKENYQSYELSTIRGETAEPSALEILYNDKKYKEVISYIPGRPFTIKEEFLRAMSYTESGDNEQAINSYKNVISRNQVAGTTTFNDDAEYYLALVFIRSKMYDSSLVILNKIKEDPAHLYHDKVSGKLIRGVNKLK